jgi:hypothetical protein
MAFAANFRYAVIGLIAGAAGFGVIDAESASAARPLLDVALGLLLFELVAGSICAGFAAIPG